MGIAINNFKSLVIPSLVGFVLGAALILISVVAAGAGHGTYIPAALFFPGLTLIAILMKTFTNFSLCLAAVQWPAYGIIVGLAKGAPNRAKYIKWLIVQHLLLLLLCFLFDDGQIFSLKHLKHFSVMVRQFERIPGPSTAAVRGRVHTEQARYGSDHGHALSWTGPDKTCNDAPKADRMAGDTYARFIGRCESARHCEGAAEGINLI